MSSITFTTKIEGLDALQKAIRKSPETVASEINMFLQRTGALLRKGIQNNPWMVGASGGGAPKDTGHLRDTHRSTIDKYSLKIEPMAPYAEFVHEGTSKMKARPWLKFTLDSSEQGINGLGQKMIEAVIAKLATS